MFPTTCWSALAAERNYSFSTVTMDELKSLAGGLDALYLTPNAPHQMALFTGEKPLEDVPNVRPPAALDAFYVTRLQRNGCPRRKLDAGDYVHFDARALRSEPHTGSRRDASAAAHQRARVRARRRSARGILRAGRSRRSGANGVDRVADGDRPMVASRAVQPRPPSRFASRPTPRRDAPIRIASPASKARTCGRVSRLAHATDQSCWRCNCDFCERELRVEYVGHARSHRYYRFDENLQGYVRQWIEEGSLAVFESVKQAEEGGYEPYKRGPQREIMNADEIVRALESLAEQMIADVVRSCRRVDCRRIQRGAMLALRLRDLIEGQDPGSSADCAALDVYKPADALHPHRRRRDFDVEDRTIMLVDDVINSGWTVQRAMASIWQRGRPAAVKLAVLIDRGHRALPIRPNYVGKNIPTARTDRVQVRLAPVKAESKSKSHDRVMVYSIVEPMKEPEAVP